MQCFEIFEGQRPQFPPGCAPVRIRDMSLRRQQFTKTPTDSSLCPLGLIKHFKFFSAYNFSKLDDNRLFYGELIFLTRLVLTPQVFEQNH